MIFVFIPEIMVSENRGEITSENMVLRMLEPKLECVSLICLNLKFDGV